MKFVQQAVGLRGYAARDPLTEYKLEGFKLFQDMTSKGLHVIDHNNRQISFLLYMKS